jgi:hypothetical protein
MTIQEIEEQIAETERQEAVFRLAGDDRQVGWWILERVKLRGLLINKMFETIR